jgi:hypothetical protein
MRPFRADPDLMESSGRVKMLAKTTSWSGCREPMRTETALVLEGLRQMTLETPMPERAEHWSYELTKLMIAGNAAGLLATVSAADKAHSYLAVLLLVKICAVIFLIGLLCSVFAVLSQAAMYSTLDRLKRNKLTEQEMSEFEASLDGSLDQTKKMQYTGAITLLGGATVGIVGLLLY